MEIEADQQVRTQADTFPSNKHQHVIVGKDQREHGEHEEVEVSEEPVVAAFMRHVASGINMDQHADARDEEQPDAGERVEKKSGVSLKGSLCAVVRDVIQVPGVGAEPGVENSLIRLVVVRRSPVGILQDRAARHEECQDDRPNANGTHRRLLQLTPEEEHERRANSWQQRDEVYVL